MNKKFVYQVGNNKKVILWCTANQISRCTELCSVCYSRQRKNSTKLVLSVFLVTGPYKPPLLVRFCPDCNSVSCLLRNRIFVPSLGLNLPQLHEPPLAGRVFPGGLGSRTLHCVCYFLSLSRSQIGRQKRGARRGLCGGGSGIEMRHSYRQPHGYNTVIHCSWTAVCQLENVSGLSTDYLDLQICHKKVFSQTILTGEFLLYSEESHGSLDHSGTCLC